MLPVLFQIAQSCIDLLPTVNLVRNIGESQTAPKFKIIRLGKAFHTVLLILNYIYELINYV